MASASIPTAPTDPATAPVIPAPNAPVAPNSPGEVGSWESEFGSSFEAPASAPAKAPAPAPAAPEPPKTPAPAPAAKEAPKPPGAPAKPAPVEQGGRKSKLDPEELLAVEGANEVELPKEFLDAIQKADARDLRLQSAKLAKFTRSQQQKIKQVETELAESRKPKDDPEKKALLEERARLQKQYEEAQVELRHTNYLKSDEYKEKFEKPWHKKLAKGYSMIKEFQVLSEDGIPRDATQKDFDRILEAPRGNRRALAKEMFGDAAQDILDVVRDLSDIRDASVEAAEEYRTKGSEFDKKKQAQEAEVREAHKQIWQQTNQHILEKYKHVFGEEENDPEGNELLKKGYADVDKVNDPNLPIEDRIRRQAAIRHSAAALSKWVHKATRLQKRVEELEKTVADYEASAPTKGSADGSPPATQDQGEDWEKEIAKLGKPAGP